MCNLIILVGVPGCGKSTWAKNFFDLKYNIVSSDEIREGFGDVNNQDRNDEVFKVFHRRILNNLNHGVDTIADSTALTRESRLRLEAIAAFTGAKTHLVFFKNPDQAVMNNARRDRKVPDEAMAKMMDKYERALLEIPQERYYSKTEIKKVG